MSPIGRWRRPPTSNSRRWAPTETNATPRPQCRPPDVGQCSLAGPLNWLADETYDVVLMAELLHDVEDRVAAFRSCTEYCAQRVIWPYPSTVRPRTSSSTAALNSDVFALPTADPAFFAFRLAKAVSAGADAAPSL